MINAFNCCFIHDQLLQSQHLFDETVWVFRRVVSQIQFCLSHSQFWLLSNVDDTIDVSTELLLILSIVSFLSSWLWIILHLDEITSDATSHACNFLIACSYWDQYSIYSWECSWYLVSWCSAVKAKRSKSLRVVFWWLEYKKFISHESFDKLRKLFQSIWCSWSVVTAVNNRELEMIDVYCWECQWEIERLKSIVVRCRLLIASSSLLLLELFELRFVF